MELGTVEDQLELICKDYRSRKNCLPSTGFIIRLANGNQRTKIYLREPLTQRRPLSFESQAWKSVLLRSQMPVSGVCLAKVST